MMKVQIREQGVRVTAALREHVARRLGLALGRFAPRIGPVSVRFSDHGGSMRCEVDVGLRPRKVRVEDIDADPLAAFDYASDRIASSVRRALDREREWDEAAMLPRTPGGSRT
jgi:ribosomal subunit interface protein